MKRVILFVLTNLAVVLTLTLLARILGLDLWLANKVGTDLTGFAVFCLVWGMGGALIALALSRWMAKTMMRVKLVDGRTGQAELDWLHVTVQDLAQRANLPMPQVGYYQSAEVNAFATGPSRKRSLVAVSSGLLQHMPREEVEAVLAHEMSHIGNGDMVTMTLLQGVINAFVLFFARVLALALRGDRDRGGAGSVFLLEFLLRIVLSILGSLVVCAFSRWREYRADRGSAELNGSQAMIAALRRLQSTRELVDPTQTAVATMKIAGAGHLARIFMTHPPLAERIAALERAA
jgi:heat shock protein HtpX